MNPNARCVLRSNELGLNLSASVAVPLDLNREILGPRHTPYLSHGSAVRHMAYVAPPPGAYHGHTFPAVANTNDLCTGSIATCEPKRAVCSAVQ